jgi:hypothetical protein
VVAGAATAAAAAVILGEYELEGLTPIIAGVLLGLIVAEVVTVVGRHRDVAAAGTSAVLAAGGVAWGAWLSTGPDEDWSFVPDLAWAGVAIAAVAALLWVRTPGRRGAGSRQSP